MMSTYIQILWIFFCFLSFCSLNNLAQILYGLVLLSIYGLKVVVGFSTPQGWNFLNSFTIDSVSQYFFYEKIALLQDSKKETWLFIFNSCIKASWLCEKFIFYASSCIPKNSVWSTWPFLNFFIFSILSKLNIKDELKNPAGPNGHMHRYSKT